MSGVLAILKIKGHDLIIIYNPRPIMPVPEFEKNFAISFLLIDNNALIHRF